MGGTPHDDNALLTTLVRRLDVLEHDVRGNGSKGLKQKMARAESHLFYNPDTKDPGVIQKVNDHATLIAEVRAQLRFGNWLLSFLLGGGVVWVIRAVFLPVS